MKHHGAILDKVFVVDVESTCWETPEEARGQPSEIIEIGICQLHIKSGVIDEVSSYLIKPQFSTVSEFCTQLTGWKQDDVKDAANMAYTLLQIKKDYGIEPNHIWASFGEYDRKKLSAHEKGGVGDLYHIDKYSNPFARMRTHINIKTLMALKEGLSKEPGMDRALQFYGLTLDGRHHNGADDAANIAKIVRKLLS